MADIKKLFCQRNRIVEDVQQLQNQIRGSESLQLSFVHVKQYETDLQHLYQEYQSLYSRLLSALPAERYDDLDENALRFDAIHTDACVLVETLLVSHPSTGNRCNQTPLSSYFATSRAPRQRTPRIRSRSPSQTTKQPVPIPNVMKRPSTSPPVEQLPSPFPPDEMKTSLILAKPMQSEELPCDDFPKTMIPANGPAKVQSESGLAEVIHSQSPIKPRSPPSVTTVQKCHHEEKPTNRERTPTNREAQVTTVAQPENPIPTCEMRPPNPIETSQEDLRLRNESSENVNSKIDVSPCEPSHAFSDDDCAMVELKNKNHQTPPPRKKPAKDDPMTNLIPILTEKIDVPPKLASIPMPAEFDAEQKPFRPRTTGSLPEPQPLLNKAGPHPVPYQLQCVIGSHPVLQLPYAVRSHPKLPEVLQIPPKDKPYRTAPQVPPEPKRFFLLRELPPINQLVPNIAGSSPSTEPALASTGAHPTFKPSRIPAGASPVDKPPEKLWIMVDPHFDPSPINFCRHFHADLIPKKPPDDNTCDIHPPEDNCQDASTSTGILSSPGQYVRAQTAPETTWSAKIFHVRLQQPNASEQSIRNK